ncbi:MGMT family protein [Luteimicrobium subarcticum]|uniref:O(6)-alkylguanine repair protein YbaZ n=1 Tax=Luteimicrobium subarcticum TaxID=620910 RepID=A0A2M8WU98_9MICO|nr:MGMT family protein [Luteimicrobium subarcticum]PJI94484.1 O(6)-alkylguanine repair protein YbaZ [Luteimicrobium subarcticum]
MDDDYLDAVLSVVVRVPPGRATTYGLVAEFLRDHSEPDLGVRGRGGPRQVGTVLSRAGSGVPWWRVVNASGAPPARHATRALDALRAEGCPLTADGARVRLRDAVWLPD